MNDTKENILLVALKLFAKDGYETVSMSQIAGELGMVKSALYKHYKNKRDIFDSIIVRMNEMDYERAKEFEAPEGTMKEIAEGYKRLSLEKIKMYSVAQFKHWTEEDFSSSFRRMLILEQYRSEEMAKLYQRYLVKGPLDYMEELFESMTGKNKEAKQLSIEFYAPMFLLYSLYDNAENKEEVIDILKEHIDRFSKRVN